MRVQRVPTFAGIAVIALGAAFAWRDSAALPYALAALLIGAGVAYAGWTGVTIRKIGPAGVEFNRELVRETLREYEARQITGAAAVTIPPPTTEAHGQTAHATGTAFDGTVQVSESGAGVDEAQVNTSDEMETYEQLAMFAKTPQELAKIMVDAIEAIERERTGP